jgi:hypothetical protein
MRYLQPFHTRGIAKRMWTAPRGRRFWRMPWVSTCNVCTGITQARTQRSVRCHGRAGGNRARQRCRWGKSAASGRNAGRPGVRLCCTPPLYGVYPVSATLRRNVPSPTEKKSLRLASEAGASALSRASRMKGGVHHAPQRRGWRKVHRWSSWPRHRPDDRIGSAAVAQSPIATSKVRLRILTL